MFLKNCHVCVKHYLIVLQKNRIWPFQCFAWCVWLGSDKQQTVWLLQGVFQSRLSLSHSETLCPTFPNGPFINQQMKCCQTSLMKSGGLLVSEMARVHQLTLPLSHVSEEGLFGFSSGHSLLYPCSAYKPSVRTYVFCL